MQTTSVTLGLLLDQEGYIVTRLANIPAPNNPLPLTIYPAGTRGGQFQAIFIGMDSVTGFCLLKIENLPAHFTNIVTAPPPPPPGVQRPIQLWGFNPKQRGSGTPGVLLIKPRLFTSTGMIKKAVDDFRYSPSNPLFYLTSPTTLTPVQDCSVAVEKDGSITGLVAYDTSGEETHFVFPLSRLQQLAAMIIAHKRIVVPHAWLGATSKGYDPHALVPNKLTATERGVLIAAVFPDSPAETAGMRPNDMLLSISGRPLTTGADLSSTLRLLPADSEVTLRVRRGNEFKILPARLAPAPALDAKQQINWMMGQMEDYERRAKQLPTDDPNRAKNESKAAAFRTILGGIWNAAPPEVWLRLMYGVEGTAVTPQLAKYLSAPGGVLISTLNASGKLAQAGGKVGDVIVKIGEQTIADAASLMQALSSEKGDQIEIVLVRQGQAINLTIAK
ncbi:MAG: PDZ domain-containing protein [Acidobacteria bacterium]|nr:PDZ domain-containing protein [Acidobacteriota bacterium]